MTCCSSTGWWVLSTDGTFLFTMCSPSGRQRGKSEVLAKLNRFKLPSGICHWPFQGGTPAVSLALCLWRLSVLHTFIMNLLCFLFLLCLLSVELYSLVFVLCLRVCGCWGCFECCFPWLFLCFLLLLQLCCLCRVEAVKRRPVHSINVVIAQSSGIAWHS